MPSQRFKVFLVLLQAAVVVLAFLLMDTPPSKEWQKARVLIPKGTASSEVARLLAAKNILRHPAVFRMLVLATGTGKRIKYGEYAFSDPPSTAEIWWKLYRGEVLRYQVTIPEGSNLYDIAQILGSRELADPEKFLEATSSPEILRRLGIPGETAEGFLFPETYQFKKAMSPADILETMVRLFRRRIPAEWENRGREEGFSLHQLITIASIIEKETGVKEEEPLVSAVIRNRLALGMPLQMDPTVIYGLRRFGTELTKKDLQAPSPYNTYLNRGLPPGPIANPGISTIRAALFPAKTDYLYFVSRNDGSHTFSRTLEEHNRGVAYLRKDKTAE
jgi:UPF0755 protein